MSDVFKFVKKVFTLGVVSSTMLWSVGASFLVTGVATAAACPALAAGDMVKVVGKPAIYAVNNGLKILYFPDGDVFKSWRPTYGGYISISQECFDSLPVPSMYPGGVNYHPGSVVVKRSSSDQLYVVEPGNTLAKITMAGAQALYGSNFKAVTILDQFWPHYVNRGADLTGTNPHPGMLVSNGGKTWWVNTDGTLSEVTSAGFTANGFQTRYVHSVTDAMIAGMSFGAKVDGAVAAVTDKTQSGGVVSTPGPVTPVTGGNLTVSLASDNPAGGYLATKTALNPVLKLTLTSASGDTKVTSLRLRKGGYLGNTSISGVDVVDSKGHRHGNTVTSLTADNDALLTFTNDPIVVHAGTPETVTVRINLSGVTSGVIQFSLVANTSVTSDGTVGGSFPVAGNQFNVQDGTNSVAFVQLDTQAVNATGIQLNADPVNEQEIAKFKIQNTNNNEAVNLYGITVFNNGNAADTDFVDVQLVDQTGMVVATAQSVNKYVMFDLSAKPFFIDKGNQKTFTVRAKIVNGTSRTIQFVVYNDYDLMVKGSTTGAFVLPTTNDAVGNANATAFPVGNKTDYNKVTIGTGSMTFNKDATSPTSAVVPGTNNVVLAKFFAKPVGEDYELRKITLAITTSSAATTKLLSGTVYVKVNGAVVYSQSASGVSKNSGAPDTDTLSTYTTLTAGVNSYITVEANIDSNATSADTYRVYLNLQEAKRVITNDIVTNGNAGLQVTQAYGNLINVNSGALNVTTLSVPVSQSIVAGSNNFELARIELNAGSSGEDARVSSVTVSSTKVGTGALYSDVTNLVMFDLATGLPIQTTNSTATNGATVAFNFAQPIVVGRQAPVVLSLHGDVVARSVSSGSESFKFLVDNVSTRVTATGKDTGNTIDMTGHIFGTGQAMTIVSNGNGTLSLVSGAGAAPSIDQLVAVGTGNVNVFAFKVSAQNEALKLTQLTLTATGAAISSNDVVNLRLYRNSEANPFATGNQMTCTSPTVCTFTWTATDNLFADAVQPTAPITVTVKADVGAAGSAKLGESFKFSIAATTTDFVAKGAYSGVTTSIAGTPAAGGTSYIVPFTVSVTGEAPAAGSSQTQAINSGTQIGRFKVTNAGTTQVTLTNFLVTDSGSQAGTSTLKLQYSDQNSTNYTGYTAQSGVAHAATTSFSSFGSPITIDGGAARYFTVSVDNGSNLGTGDTFNLSIGSLGDVKYSVTETNLGYEGNADNNGLIDTITGLFADGKPTLGTLVKQ